MAGGRARRPGLGARSPPPGPGAGRVCRLAAPRCFVTGTEAPPALLAEQAADRLGSTWNKAASSARTALARVAFEAGSTLRAPRCYTPRIRIANVSRRARRFRREPRRGACCRMIDTSTIDRDPSDRPTRPTTRPTTPARSPCCAAWRRCASGRACTSATCTTAPACTTWCSRSSTTRSTRPWPATRRRHRHAARRRLGLGVRQRPRHPGRHPQGRGRLGGRSDHDRAARRR